MKRLLLAIIVALPLLVVACSSEDPAAPDESFRNLTKKDDTIADLRVAYRERDVNELGRVIDEFYQFCYTINMRTSCFDRASDMTITESLFQPALLPDETEPITRVDIEFTSGGNWVSTTPPDPDRYDGETFWEKVVDYQITVIRESGNERWGGAGRATFIIRQVAFEGANRWRILGIADHSGQWGDLKSIYNSLSE